MGFKVQDHFFKKAKKESYLARSVYKLEEIDKRFKILKKGDVVIDIGYFPGSWIQYTSPAVGSSGKVVGLDIQKKSSKLSHLKNVSLFEMDATVLENLSEIGIDQPLDVILSDMAPNTTGIKLVDQEKSLILVQKVFSLAEKFLKLNGNLVAKVFESAQAQVFLKTQKSRFKEFHYLRPKSTRSVSKEFFVVAKGFKA